MKGLTRLKAAQAMRTVAAEAERNHEEVNRRIPPWMQKQLRAIVKRQGKEN